LHLFHGACFTLIKLYGIEAGYRIVNYSEATKGINRRKKH